jgi:uncharacterized protein YceK
MNKLSLVRSIAILCAIAAVTLMSGCSTLADARSAKGTGQSREYHESIDVVWKTVPAALAELSLPLVSENRQDGYILAQRGITAFSYGENVAIFIEPVNGIAQTRVEIVCKRAMSTNIFAPDWGKEILDKLSEKLSASVNTAHSVVSAELKPSTASQIALVSAKPSSLNTLPVQGKSDADRLRDLNTLYKDGVINQKDFDAKKQEILKSM